MNVFIGDGHEPEKPNEGFGFIVWVFASIAAGLMTWAILAIKGIW